MESSALCRPLQVLVPLRRAAAALSLLQPPVQPVLEAAGGEAEEAAQRLRGREGAEGPNLQESSGRGPHEAGTAQRRQEERGEEEQEERGGAAALPCWVGGTRGERWWWDEDDERRGAGGELLQRGLELRLQFLRQVLRGLRCFSGA